MLEGMPGPDPTGPAVGGPSSPLVGLRVVFGSFVAMVLAIGVVVVVLASSTDAEGAPLSGAVACTVVAVLGVVLVALSRSVGGRLRCGEPAEILTQHRSRWFVRIALSEAAALLGFAAFFLSGNPMTYAVGLALTLVGFARLAPTVAHLQAEDDELRGMGCPHSLHDLLCRPAAPTR